MTSFKLAVIAALSSFAVSAFALSPMQDSDLSAVSGQDGVAIAANLNISVQDFTYTATNDAKFQFQDIAITGAIAATIDVMTGTQFHDNDASAASPTSVLKVIGGAGLAAFEPAADLAVVKIAIPEIESLNKVNVSVGKMLVGGINTGAISMTNIRLQGTTAYIWARKG